MPVGNWMLWKRWTHKWWSLSCNSSSYSALKRRQAGTHSGEIYDPPLRLQLQIKGDDTTISLLYKIQLTPLPSASLSTLSENSSCELNLELTWREKLFRFLNNPKLNVWSMVYTVTDVIMGNYGSVTVLLLADVKCLRIGYVRYFRAHNRKV